MMPQFILESAGTVGALEFRDLDAFTQGYIEALFFTESDTVGLPEFMSPENVKAREEGQRDGELPRDSGFSDLSPEALQSIMTDCAEFQKAAGDLLRQAYEVPGYDEAAAGRDLWFTRNGHGVGYWDRGLGQVGDDLADMCGWRTPFAEVNPYWDAESGCVRFN